MSTPPAPVPPPAHTPSPSPLPVLNADGSIPAADDAAARVRTRVVLVGIGGATCSGKTTLAKHLRAILPNSFIIHQDDFAPPESTLPLHPTLHVQDWDSAPTALAWPRLRAFLRTAKRAATLPPDHHSHDHLNAQRPVPVGEGLAGRWAAQFRGVQERLEAGAEGVHVVWGLVDGFLLYWDPEVVETLDAKFFLRVPRATLEARRVERSGYYTADSPPTCPTRSAARPPWRTTQRRGRLLARPAGVLRAARLARIRRGARGDFREPRCRARCADAAGPGAHRTAGAADGRGHRALLRGAQGRARSGRGGGVRWQGVEPVEEP